MTDQEFQDKLREIALNADMTAPECGTRVKELVAERMRDQPGV